MDSALLQSVAVLFVATIVRSAFGFGEALIAVPLLALLMPVEVAVPVAVLASVTVAIQILIQDWSRIHWSSAWRLVLATLPGVPIGVWGLRALPERTVEGALGAIIVAFAIYSLRHGRGPELRDDRWAWLFGFVAGVLGGAYGVNGPPLVVYGAMRRWTPVYFRATLQAYFFPASVIGMTGYWLAGVWTAEVNRLYVTSLPAILLAAWLGRVLNRKLHPERFLDAVYVVLFAVGALLLWRSWNVAGSGN